MKFIYDDPRTMEHLPAPNSMQGWICVGVFFHGRGSEVQKTFEGLLRAILYQLLWKCRVFPELSDLLSLISVLRTQQNRGKARSHPGSTWTEEDLGKALRMIMNQQHVALDVLLLVDALDEHSGDIRQLTTFLKETFTDDMPGSRVRFKLVVASRDEHEIRAVLDGKLMYEPLDVHRWTRGDITRFVRDNLCGHDRVVRFLHTRKSKEALEQLLYDIVERAHGVFLWVRLVVTDLLVELDKGVFAVQTLQGLLDRLPATLPEYFDDILRRIDPSDRLEALLLFELVLRAAEPWTLGDLAQVEQYTQQNALGYGLYFEHGRCPTEETLRQAKMYWRAIQENPEDME